VHERLRAGRRTHHVGEDTRAFEENSEHRTRTCSRDRVVRTGAYHEAPGSMSAMPIQCSISHVAECIDGRNARLHDGASRAAAPEAPSRAENPRMVSCARSVPGVLHDARSRKAFKEPREEHRHTYKKRSYSIRLTFTWSGQGAYSRITLEFSCGRIR
jgi:hypothetical protein